MPAYRALDVEANDGPDVAQLEQALVDLGHGAGVTVDEHFDSGTAAAVERWEDALGRDEPDGRVELGDVAFAAGPVRIGTISADVGTRVQEGSTVLAGHAHRARRDRRPRRQHGPTSSSPAPRSALTMPDGAETTGTVATIGTEAEASDDQEGALAPGGGGGPTVPVTITLDDPTAAARSTPAAVDVAIERSREDGATAVPVTALLALAEGGYAVELPGRTARPDRWWPSRSARTPRVGSGVTGDGIEPGVEVVVPA